MFEEAAEPRHGPKRVAVNEQYVYAVQVSTLGMHAVNQLLAPMDIKPPTKSGWKRIARRVNDEMKEFINKDLESIWAEKID